MKWSFLSSWTSLAAALCLFCPAGAGSQDTLSAALRSAMAHSPLPAVPADPTNGVLFDPRAQRLGAQLFVDVRLSARHDMSCASCHRPEAGWSDARRVARLRTGDGIRRTPSLRNVAHNRWFNWDGSADSLWAQVLGPIENAEELGGGRMQVARLVAGDREYADAVREIFGIATLRDCDRAANEASTVSTATPCFKAVGQSLAAYVATIVSAPNRFDQFLTRVKAGAPADQAGLSQQEIAGLELFFGRARCSTCHTGPLFTNGEFHNLAIYPTVPGGWKDSGRLGGVRKLLASEFNALSSGLPPERLETLPTPHLNQNPAQWGQFKTPSLRNVASQSFFMHHGQFSSLEQVVDFYSDFTGLDLTDHHRELSLMPLRLSTNEKESLVSFLRLIGE